jgi:hypothetical protein
MSNHSLEHLLDSMWRDYTSFNPQAKKIHDAFLAEGEHPLNDHIALRTIQHPMLGIDQLGRVFEKLGYEKRANYEFKEKKLFAWHYEHRLDPSQPKIFISELLLEQFSPFCQQTLNRLIASIPESDFAREDFSLMGRPWELSSEEYLKLAAESEYASWVAAFGFRPNHFTILVNGLKKLGTLPKINEFVKNLGFKLNSAGGEIKGSVQEMLEQSSTMAESIPVKFSDQTLSVPACYYEFAIRHPLQNGKLYQGFVATSADKIFESTNRTQ